MFIFFIAGLILCGQKWECTIFFIAFVRGKILTIPYPFRLFWFLLQKLLRNILRQK
jgi:hypothetical protein